MCEPGFLFPDLIIIGAKWSIPVRDPNCKNNAMGRNNREKCNAVA
jgi:hypothetical protein